MTLFKTLHDIFKTKIMLIAQARKKVLFNRSPLNNVVKRKGVFLLTVVPESGIPEYFVELRFPGARVKQNDMLVSS